MPRPGRTVLLLGLGTAVSLLGDLSLYALLPTCFADLGLLPYQVGLLLSANRWVRLVTNHLAAVMVRRWGPAGLLASAFGVGAALTLLYSLAPPFLLFVAARCLWGLCWSLIRQVGAMTTVRTSASHELGGMMGVYEAVSRAGAALGAFLGGVAYDALGYQAGLAVLALASLGAVPIGLAAMRSARPMAADTPPSPAEDGRGGWALPICACAGAAAISLLVALLGLLITREFGETVTLIGVAVGVTTLNGFLVGAQWLSDSIAGAPLGVLGDRLGWGRLATGLCALGAVTLLTVWLSSGLAMLPGVLAFYVARTGQTVLLGAQAGRRGHRAYAMYATADDAGLAAGPLLGWALVDALPSPAYAVLIALALQLIGLVAAPWAFGERIQRGVPPL